jgi:hypothetical protein
MSSAVEAELGALFINAKTAVSMLQTLIKLGHLQSRTPMQTDNATAHALLTNKILPKALKAMDMHFHWLRCHNAQGHSIITGDLAHRTWQITSPSITLQHTTSLYTQQSSQQSTIQNTGNSSSHCWPYRQTNHRAATIGPPARKQENPENRAGKKRTNNENHRNTNKNFCPYKILCQNSLTDTTNPRHAAKQDHSKRCLRILRQGCVRPTTRYVPIGGKVSLNKRFPPRAQNSLRNT